MKKIKILLFFLLFILIVVATSFYIYKRDRNKFEPKLWIGLFDYRLNLRDVGQSLNECLNKNVFRTGLIYRSNKYFSGWSCEKIKNPGKIYSLNYSPWNPHAYYCEQSNGTRQYGFHPNTSFEISRIEDLSRWEKPEFRETMCVFFKQTLQDVIERKSFLYHCDVGRDRTGAFTAMFTMMLAEQKSYDTHSMQDAIECDYEKTRALEKEKIGKMKTFMQELEQQGGVSYFIEKQCGISKQTLKSAADNFFL